MQKSIKLLLFVLFFSVATNISVVSAEEITDFTQTVEIQKNSSLLITETISYDFGDLERHGIYRDITYKYKARGGNYNLSLDILSVKDKQGQKYKFSISTNGNDKRIKIGDADTLVSGLKTYVIKYKIERGINHFEEWDELYWNVTGSQWEVPILQSKTTVILPKAINENVLDSVCYTGVFGSTEACVSKRYIYEGAGMVKEMVFIDDFLQAGNNFTVAVSLPKGIVQEPSVARMATNIVKDNVVLLLPIFIFIYMFRLWREKGRDEAGRGVIVAQFDTIDKLSPMGVGTIVDSRADNKDFSANIISLAVKGYLKIVKIQSGKIFKKDEYIFVSQKGTEVLRKSEKSIYDKIFRSKYIEVSEKKLLLLEDEIQEDAKVVFLSNLKDKFYSDLSTIKKDIKDELTDAGYFDKAANKLSLKYIFISLGQIIVWLAFFIFIAPPSPISIFSMILTTLIMIIFSVMLPRMTKKGSLAKEHVLGLKKYLEVAEKDRLDFHNAPERNPETFEKLLPYAMALGVEKKWAKQFEDIYTDVSPSWYSSYDGRAFSAIALTNNIGLFASAANASAASAPSSASSGGSGFSGGGSGGGFGGGGGGSW